MCVLRCVCDSREDVLESCAACRCGWCRARRRMQLPRQIYRGWLYISGVPSFHYVCGARHGRLTRQIDRLRCARQDHRLGVLGCRRQRLESRVVSKKGSLLPLNEDRCCPSTCCRWPSAAYRPFLEPWATPTITLRPCTGKSQTCQGHGVPQLSPPHTRRTSQSSSSSYMATLNKYRSRIWATLYTMYSLYCRYPWLLCVLSPGSFAGSG